MPTKSAVAVTQAAPGGRLLPGAAWVTATALFVGIYAAIWRRQPSFAVLIQALGALAGLGGAALWARGLEAASIVPWWAGLLVLTIIGERLELARLAFVSGRTEARVLTEATAVLVSLVASLLAPAAGYPLLGLALGVLVVDVAVHDVARRTIRVPGLPRLMAACMLAGYRWALLSARARPRPAGAWVARSAWSQSSCCSAPWSCRSRWAVDTQDATRPAPRTRHRPHATGPVARRNSWSRRRRRDRLRAASRAPEAPTHRQVDNRLDPRGARHVRHHADDARHAP